MSMGMGTSTKMSPQWTAGRSRAAKDRPGRFTDGYYGTPTKSSLGRRRVL